MDSVDWVYLSGFGASCMERIALVCSVAFPESSTYRRPDIFWDFHLDT